MSHRSLFVKFLLLITHPMMQILAAFSLVIMLPLSTQTQVYFFSISTIIKQILFLFLPFIIFTYVNSALISISNGAFFLIFCILGSTIISNIIASNIGFGAMHLLDINKAGDGLDLTTSNLYSLWNLPFTGPQNSTMLMLAIVLGIALPWLNCYGFTQNNHYQKFWSLYKRTLHKMHSFSDFFLLKVFSRIIGLFLFGFIMNLRPSLASIVMNDNQLMVVPMTQWAYLMLLIVVFNQKLPNILRFVRNISSAVVNGFFTMSSAASLIFIQKACKANKVNEEVSHVTINTCINTHLIGDCIGVNILIVIILSAFGQPIPSLWEFEKFCLMYAMVKFAVVAIPGGGILVTVPLLEQYLGFNHDMSALITGLYIMLDCFFTAANVAGNCLMPKWIDFLWRRFNVVREIK